MSPGFEPLEFSLRLLQVSAGVPLVPPHHRRRGLKVRAGRHLRGHRVREPRPAQVLAVRVARLAASLHRRPHLAADPPLP